MDLLLPEFFTSCKRVNVLKTLKDCFIKVCELVCGRAGCGGPASNLVLRFLH
jgi:hypothetical protein